MCAKQVGLQGSKFNSKIFNFVSTIYRRPIHAHRELTEFTQRHASTLT